MSKIATILLSLLLSVALVGDATAAKGGGGGAKSSGGSKSTGGSKSSTGSGGSKSVSSSKPSSGSKTAPPVAKTIPVVPPVKLASPTISSTGRALPAKVSVPSGRSYSRDATFVRNSPNHYDPYKYRANGYHGAPMYYGAYDSPFFYLWLFSIMDDDQSNDALPPSADGLVSEAILSYSGVVASQQELIEAKDEVAEEDESG